MGDLLQACSLTYPQAQVRDTDQHRGWHRTAFPAQSSPPVFLVVRHKSLCPLHRACLAVLAELGPVQASRKHAPSAPAKLVPLHMHTHQHMLHTSTAESPHQSIARCLRRWQSPTPRLERRHLSTLLVHMVNRPHCRQMINARVQANLVHDRDASLDSSVHVLIRVQHARASMPIPALKLLHGRRDVARRHHVLLVCDARFCHNRMQRRRQQAASPQQVTTISVCSANLTVMSCAATRSLMALGSATTSSTT